MTPKRPGASALAFLFLSLCMILHAAAQSPIETIKSFPEKQRTARVTACLEYLHDASISGATRLELIKLFAVDAMLLSPRYGCNGFAIDEGEWLGLLTEGWEAAPTHTETVYALTQILINMKQYARAKVVIEPFVPLHPEYQMPPAFLEYAENKLAQGDHWPDQVLEFPVHFTVITNNPEATRRATLTQLHEEVAILNRRFVDLNGDPIVKFRFGSASLYDDVKDLNCAFVRLGDTSEQYDSYGWEKVFNGCPHTEVCDPHAINIFINDAYREPLGFATRICHGKSNSGRPYILFDYTRLNNSSLSPEPHEMGHAFGLGHVGVAGSNPSTHSNYMTSSVRNFGSGGRRNLGFTEDQVAIIVYNATRTRARLGLAGDRP